MLWSISKPECLARDATFGWLSFFIFRVCFAFSARTSLNGLFLGTSEGYDRPQCDGALTENAEMHENRFMDEPIFETIKRRLEDAKGDLPRIAEESGVNVWTLRNILNQRSKNPGVDACQKLLNYFRARDEMIARLRQTGTSV